MTQLAPPAATTQPDPTKIPGTGTPFDPVGGAPPATTPPQVTTTPGDTVNPLTPPTGLTADQQSARGVLNTELANFGLSSLSDTVWNWVLGGRSIDQIMLDIRATPEYKTRFPAMDALAKRGQAITESQYISYETSTQQILRSAGIDPSLFDVTQGLLNNVAPTEVQQRADLAKQAVYTAPPDVVQQLQSLYGMNSGQLASYWLNPDAVLPKLQQQFQAAQESGQAVQSGFGALTQSEAEGLAQQGVSQSQAQTGFAKLVTDRQLFTPLPGESGFAGFARAQQLGATFGGDAVSAQAIEQERQKRLAEFKGAGSFAKGTSEGGTGAVGV